MNSEMKYPFQLKNMFLTSLSFTRANEISSTIEIPIEIGVQYIEPKFPLVQVNMKISSGESALINFSTEIVGLFDYIGSQNTYDTELNREFVFEKGLFMLWPFGIQMIRLITGQMGITPLNIQTPTSFAGS